MQLGVVRVGHQPVGPGDQPTRHSAAMSPLHPSHAAGVNQVLHTHEIAVPLAVIVFADKPGLRSSPARHLHRTLDDRLGTVLPDLCSAVVHSVYV